MNENQSATMYESVPAVSELNKVKGFDPMKFLRKTKQGGKNLDLKYKKLWFRLKYPAGRIRLSALKITDELAIIEARVYFDKKDTQPSASFIAQRDAKTTPGGLYIESAQHAAIDQALSDAGFGVQFAKAEPADGRVADTAPAKEQAADIAPVREQAAQEERDQEKVAAIEGAAADDANAEGEEAEETEEDGTERSAGKHLYTADMSVGEISSLMTYEEAKNVIVPIGTCKDWTLAQVADRRPASLKWYINGYTGDDNILRAAASIIQTAISEKIAV